MAKKKAKKKSTTKTSSTSKLKSAKPKSAKQKPPKKKSKGMKPKPPSQSKTKTKPTKNIATTPKNKMLNPSYEDNGDMLDGGTSTEEMLKTVEEVQDFDDINIDDDELPPEIDGDEDDESNYF